VPLRGFSSPASCQTEESKLANSGLVAGAGCDVEEARLAWQLLSRWKSYPSRQSDKRRNGEATSADLYWRQAPRQ